MKYLGLMLVLLGLSFSSFAHNWVQEEIDKFRDEANRARETLRQAENRYNTLCNRSDEIEIIVTPEKSDAYAKWITACENSDNSEIISAHDNLKQINKQIEDIQEELKNSQLYQNVATARQQLFEARSKMHQSPTFRRGPRTSADQSLYEEWRRVKDIFNSAEHAFIQETPHLGKKKKMLPSLFLQRTEAHSLLYADLCRDNSNSEVYRAFKAYKSKLNPCEKAGMSLTRAERRFQTAKNKYNQAAQEVREVREQEERSSRSRRRLQGRSQGVR